MGEAAVRAYSELRVPIRGGAVPTFQLFSALDTIAQTIAFQRPVLPYYPVTRLA